MRAPKLKDLITESEKPILNEVLEWKDIPEEERQKAFDLVAEHNKHIDQGIKGYYAIDVTGKHQVYYTFWRYKEINPEFAAFIKNPIYMGNLTTNLLSSVESAIEKAKTTRLEIWNDETKHGLIGKTKDTLMFTFGKYRGKSLPEVYLENPSYFAFLAKNADPKYANTKMAKAIQFFSNLYFEETTKKNIETSKAKYIGNIGDKYTGELEVYKIDVKESLEWGKYTIYKLKDSDENKFMIFNLEKSFPDVKVGNKVKLKGKIKGHKEIVGIKFNILNYVKAD